MICDGHVHTLGHEQSAPVLAALDRVGIQRICLLSPPWLDHAETQRRGLAFIDDLCATDPDRLLGYFWLNPLLPAAPDLVAEAAARPNVRALKLMSDHWYPHDPGVRRALDAIATTGLPILFHAGILWSHMDSSRYCRPVEFEVMLHYPTVRFALAHVAWPWVDECLAVYQRVRHGIKEQTGGETTMYIDLSPGTPLEIREEVLRRTVLLAGVDHLLYGSDDSEPERLEKAGNILSLDREIFGSSLRVTHAQMASIFGRNHLRFLGMEETS